MRVVLMVVVAVGLVFLAGTVNAAQPGQVPNATLARLGLSRVQPMTDAQGLGIRGSGFAMVNGTNTATAASFLGGATSGPHVYTSTSSTPTGTSALAAGASGAAAGGGFVVFPPGGGASIRCRRRNVCLRGLDRLRKVVGSKLRPGGARPRAWQENSNALRTVRRALPLLEPCTRDARPEVDDRRLLLRCPRDNAFLD